MPLGLAVDVDAQAVDSILGVPKDSMPSTSCPVFDPNEMCRKNKGDGERSFTYSRGYLFAVRGSGIIVCLAPIYRY